MGKLDNKIALVTGASRGIGRSIAERLAADGAHVIVNYVSSRAEAAQLAEHIRAEGGSASIVGADLSDLAAIDAMFGTIAADFPQIDILINNAGRGSNGMPTLEASTPEDFDRLVGLNMRGLFFVTQRAARMMRDGGRIVNISSTTTLARVPGLSIYAGTKAAVEAFTRIWSVELASRRITVNAVLPSITETDLIANLPPDMTRKVIESIPLGRIGLPRDIANAVAFLVSDDAEWITGQNLVSAGGAA
jgi:3-oxoacyl-[acyl-carrier protein] reductase